MEANNNNGKRKKKRKNQRAVNGMLADVSSYPSATGASGGSNSNSNSNNGAGGGGGKWKNAISIKARSLMNLHNNEAGRRVSFLTSNQNIITYEMKYTCLLFESLQFA